MKVEEYPRITIILRNVSSQVIDWIVQAISSNKFDFAVEITMNSSNSDLLAQYVRQYPELKIGAGTVLTKNDAKHAIAAGCQFILSPIVLPVEIVEFCKQQGVLVVSGAYSPTEVWKAYQSGSDIVKVFPIRNLGKDYIRDIKAPLGNIPIMAVGGVSADCLIEYFSHDIDYVGIGTGLFGKNLASLNEKVVEQQLAELNHIVTNYLS